MRKWRDTRGGMVRWSNASETRAHPPSLRARPSLGRLPVAQDDAIAPPLDRNRHLLPMSSSIRYPLLTVSHI
jgi:hypothetical protein